MDDEALRRAAEGPERVTGDEAEADVAPQLPIHAHAHDVLLIEELEPNSARWATRARLPFHVP